MDYMQKQKEDELMLQKKMFFFLSKQLSYSLHKPTRKLFIRKKKPRAMYIDEVWQMDLCETYMLQKYNDGHKYSLTC